jgi:hypothetical protein
MKRSKTVKLTLIAALSIAPFGWANAVCHNVIGQWVASYDEVFGGDTIAGVGNAIVSATTIQYWGAESFLGENTLFFASGPYTIDQFCNFVWTYTVDDGTSGEANGVVVNVNQMNVIFSNPDSMRSGRVILQRLEFFN